MASSREHTPSIVEADKDEMTVKELRAEIAHIVSWAHSHDDRITDGEVSHGRPLRTGEIAGVSMELKLKTGVVSGPHRPRSLVREDLELDEGPGPLTKDELVQVLEAVRDVYVQNREEQL